MDIITLFSTPVYISKIKSVTKKELEFVEKQEYERVFLDNGYYTKNKYILNLPKLKRLKKEVEEHIRIYTKEVLCVSDKQDFYLTNSWIVKHDKNDWSQPHIHTNSLISGVLYLKVFQNSGFIVFKNETGLFPTNLDIEYKHHNPLNSTIWRTLPEDNMIILFPSNMYHSVTPCDSDESRYSLAFNCFVRGKFGEKEYELELP